MKNIVFAFLISLVVGVFVGGYIHVAVMPERVMSRSMTNATSVDAIDETTIRAPVNKLAHSAGLYTADLDVTDVGATAPMADMLYSIAWVDVSEEPMIVSVPDFADRYYAITFTSIENVNTGYIGTRATGGSAGQYALVTSDWQGDLPAGVKRFELSTPQAQGLMRVFVADADDYKAADLLRRQVTFQLLSDL